METIFTKIIKGEIPSYKVAEDDDFYAFLDINPLAEGHTLVVPKQAVDYVFDIEDKTLGNMMIFAKKVAVAIKKNIPCERVGVAIVGLEVPHAHIHLIPLQRESDMLFTNSRVKLSSEEMIELADAIKSNF